MTGGEHSPPFFEIVSIRAEFIMEQFFAISMDALDWLVILRMGLGFFWLWQVTVTHKKLQKMDETLRLFAKENPIRTYKVFIESFMLPNIKTIWILVTALEISAAISFIFGIFAPISAVLMLVLEVNFLLSRPNSILNNILPMLLEFTIAFSGSGAYIALIPFSW